MADDPLINFTLTLTEPEYWTGEQAWINATVDMISATEVYSKPTITMMFPSEYIQSVNATDMAGQTSETVVNDGKN